MKQKFYLLITTIFLLSSYSMAQFPRGQSVKPYIGQTGIKKNVSELLQAAAAKKGSSKPLDQTAVKPFKSYFKRYQDADKPSRYFNNAGALQLKKAGDNHRPVAPLASSSSGSTIAGAAQQIGSNFLGIDFYENPIGWPPDPSGAVGVSQVTVASNNGIAVFNKPGATDPPLLTPTGYSSKLAKAELFLSLEVFFSPVLPAGSGISDPHIRYDRLTHRWYIVAIEVNPTFENNLILLAVSDGDKITDGSSFFYYAFNSSLFPYDPNAPFAPFLDYPTLGIDKNSILIGGNQFGFDSLTNVGYVIDKKELIHGNLIVYPFELGVVDFVSGNIGGMYTPQSVHNDDAAARKSFFAGISYFQDGLVVAELEYDKRNHPWFAREALLPVQPFNNPRDNSSPGALIPLEMNDTRLLAAEIHKNKLTGKSSLWTAHAIGVDQWANYIFGSDSDFVRDARTGSRWYEIGNIYSSPALKQSGTVYDAEQPSGRRAMQYFNPSIAASGQGHAVMGGTADAYNQYLNVFTAGRFNSDPDGSFRKPVKPTTTTAMYAPYIDLGGGSHIYVERWGDFSQTVVDPWDDQTIWTFQEYADVDDSYGVRAVQLKAPPPATPLPLGPVTNKSDVTISLNGMSVDNSGFFDPGEEVDGPGYNRLSVKSSGNILVSNIKFVSPVKITFKLNVKNKPAGNYKLIISNPDGQFVIVDYQLQVSSRQEIAGKINANTTSVDNKIASNFISTVKAIPNPAKENTTLAVSAVKDQTAKIILLDLSGKRVFEKSFRFTKGVNTASIPLSNLGSGTYIAAIYNSDHILLATQKIVKE